MSHAHEHEDSVADLASVSLDPDGVLADGHSLPMATMTGSVEDGRVATLEVPV